MSAAAARDDEFYVGWQPRAPRGLARRMRRAALILVSAAAAVALAVAALQRPFAPAHFEYGVARELEGLVQAEPHPSLRVPRPGSQAGFSRYLLVAPGKHGAGPLVAGLDGQRVRLRGSLIHAGGEVLIEVVPGSVAAVEDELVPAAAPGTRERLGTRTLHGEIADSKCHLGAMNPGRRKVHRACAMNCIAGGIPPVLLVDRQDGGTDVVLLVGPEGEVVNEALLPLVAVPVEVTGELQREDDLLILAADPARIRRIDGPVR